MYHDNLFINLRYTCGRNLPKLLPKLKLRNRKWPKIFCNSGQICNADQNYIIFSAIFDFGISVSAIISANFGHMYSLSHVQMMLWLIILSYGDMQKKVNENSSGLRFKPDIFQPDQKL